MHREIFEELRAIGKHTRANLIEHLNREAAGIGGGLQHQRCDRTDKYSLGNSLGTMTADVTSDFAATGRMANMDRVF